MSGVNDMNTYRQFFGLPLDKGTPSTGIVYAIYTIGNLIGSFVAGPATDFRGKYHALY
jgi:MFS family permease